jgi:hypothetical protein
MIKLGGMITTMVTPKPLGITSKVRVEETKEIVTEAAFSRQHYEEVAKIIKSVGSSSLRGELCDKFTTLFTKDNSRFDETRFKDACNVK